MSQIFFGSKHIGGADDLEALRRQGKLNVVLDKQSGSDGLPKALATAAAEAVVIILMVTAIIVSIVLRLLYYV